MLSIAGAHGRKGATIAGLKLDEPAPPLRPQQRQKDKKGKSADKSRKRTRKKTDERKEIEWKKLEDKWQDRRKKEAAAAAAVATAAVPVHRPPTPAGAGELSPGLHLLPMSSAPATSTPAAAPAADEQPERMDDKPVFHFAAGGKRSMPLSPDPAKAMAALRALKNQREGSPQKGLNPTATAFQPSAAATQDGQQIDDAANFTRTFRLGRRPQLITSAVSCSHRWGYPSILRIIKGSIIKGSSDPG